MSKSLIIVESPAKAKKLTDFLGKRYIILASYGHVRDLRPKEGAVQPDHDFAMHYEPIEKNYKHLEKIVTAARKADSILLATDPDREGEAISWHITEVLRERAVLEDKPVKRIVFYEITKQAVQQALSEPRDISLSLVNAQQARRALDYLVGFTLSPLLWKKIRGGLSAGRVQSPALRLIVEREEAIEQFNAQEYWSVEAHSEAKAQAFTARLYQYQNKKVEQFTITDEEAATLCKTTLLQAADGKLIVKQIDKKQRKRNPAAPFITSTLQQEAVRKLGFTAQRTMRTAQQLYEAGLITYMRTDSVHLAQEALEDIRQLIQDRYGANNLPASARVFKTKSKNAQEAHEAIRPTVAQQTPEQVKDDITPEQFKLYDLIWKRTIACQMIHATLDTVAVNLACGDDHIFRATGSTITDPGFLTVYQEGHDDDNKKSDSDEKFLPAMEVDDELPLHDIVTVQHFTEPPPRYSEATLVKALEEYGIGRPSTYATIISTLQSRQYVELEKRRFYPTDVGRVVNRFLTNYFTQYVDYTFTANLEDNLDAIARDEQAWIPLMKEFWVPFKDLVDDTQENVQRKDVTQEPLDEKCPQCQHQLSIRLGKRGRFIGCTHYPECDYTRSMDGEEQTEPEKIEGRSCPDCGGDLLVKTSRYGKFIGCSNYPKCKHIENLEQPQDTNVDCPQCKQGNMLHRRSRRGKVFFSCSRYPDCQYAVWDEPVDQACPECEWPMLTLKSTKRKGAQLLCPQKECNYSAPYEADEET